MTPAHIIVALWGTGVLGLAWLILTAPEGFEDADGWHAGREPLDDFGCEGTHRPRFAASLNLHATLNATEGQRDHG